MKGWGLSGCIHRTAHIARVQQSIPYCASPLFAAKIRGEIGRRGQGRRWPCAERDLLEQRPSNSGGGGARGGVDVKLDI